MPPKKVLAANIFVIDLTIKNIAEIRKVFYRILLKCAQEKASAKSPDVYKIILVGSKETNNVNNYDHITIFSEWSLYKQEEIFETIMKDLENVVTGSQGNIFEALELAVEHIQNDMLVTNYNPKNVIVFTDLLCDTPKNVNKNALRHALEDIWLYVIGPQVKIPQLRSNDDIKTWSKYVQPGNDDVNFKNNLKIIQEVKDNGIVADLEVGSQLLFSYIADSPKPPYPWYCDMNIGDITLKVNVVKLVDDCQGFKFPKKAYEDEEEKQMYDPDSGEIVDNPVPAYKVKGRFAIFTEEQEKELAREQNEDKCFEIKYFIDSSVITPMYFGENTLSAVIADIRLSENWKQSLKILTETMSELNVAAVVKRIYAKGPQFQEMPYVLFACPDHGSECLLMAKLPFKHEIIWKNPIVHKSKEPKQIKNELQTSVSAYLSNLTIKEEEYFDGKPLYGISEYLLQHPDFTSQFDHVVNCLLDKNYPRDVRIVPAYEMNKILEKRSKESWDKLQCLLPTSTEEEDNLFDMFAGDFEPLK